MAHFVDLFVYFGVSWHFSDDLVVALAATALRLFAGGWVRIGGGLSLFTALWGWIRSIDHVVYFHDVLGISLFYYFENNLLSFLLSRVWVWADESVTRFTNRHLNLIFWCRRGVGICDNWMGKVSAQLKFFLHFIWLKYNYLFKISDLLKINPPLITCKTCL